MLAETAHCAACGVAAAAASPPPGWFPVWPAALKACSLGYLLGLAGLSTGAATWAVIQPRLAPPLRATAGFTSLLLSVLLQVALGVLVWYGVITHRILMTTNYFHHLMYGGWSQGITATGISVLGASLLIGLRTWRRAQPPRRLASGPAGWQPTWERVAAGHGLRLFPASGVATAALTGVLKPVLFVNPAYWVSLDPAQRQLALAHEALHLRRLDNLRKLLLESLTLLYSVLPGVRRWAGAYELDAELAVDDACRQLAGDAAYRLLVADAAHWSASVSRINIEGALRPARLPVPAVAHGSSHLTGSGDAPSSALTNAELAERLSVLAAPRRTGSVPVAAGASFACVLASAVPTLVLLSHPLSRCLFACYLGY